MSVGSELSWCHAPHPPGRHAESCRLLDLGRLDVAGFAELLAVMSGRPLEEVFLDITQEIAPEDGPWLFGVGSALETVRVDDATTADRVIRETDGMSDWPLREVEGLLAELRAFVRRLPDRAPVQLQMSL